MTSRLHETLAELFVQNPSLVARLLVEVFGVALPRWEQARVESADVKEVNAVERRADALVTLVDRHDRPTLAVVVEVQLRPKVQKLFRWPVYLTSVRDRRRCDVVILVVCADRATAAWAAKPIRLGPGSVVTPLALGPGLVPVVTDAAQAAVAPELAVLSALAHGRDHPQWQQVLDALWVGLQTVDRDHAGVYADVVYEALSEAARTYLEELMDVATYEPASPIFRSHWLRGKAEGKAEGEARAVLAVLAARGIDVPDGARQHIASCTDLDQLETWIRRATTAATVHDLFAD